MPIDFTQPPFYGEGVRVNGISSAKAAVAFNLYIPTKVLKDLGDLTVYLSPGDNHSGASAAYLVYNSDTYGIEWVGESLPDVAEEDVRLDWYKAAVSPDALKESEEGEIVTISDGVPALLRVSANGVATMEWVERGTQFIVLGSTITRGQALNVASVGWTHA